MSQMREEAGANGRRRGGERDGEVNRCDAGREVESEGWRKERKPMWTDGSRSRARSSGPRDGTEGTWITAN